MKQFREEKTVFRTDLHLKFLLTLLLLPVSISAQVPINGFVKTSIIKLSGNYTSLFATDFNKDGYRDLLVFNQNTKQYIPIITSSENKYVPKYPRNFQHPLHSLFYSEEKGAAGSQTVSTSLQNKSFQVMDVDKNGNTRLIRSVSFDGSPRFIDAADINLDGRIEFLTGGNSINGFKIIKERKKNLIAETYGESKIFSAASFIDLDYDGYKDVVAFNPLSNSFIFFYNDMTGGFVEQRSIGLWEEVKNFKALDINSDGFTDLVYSKYNGVEAILGDSVSSFQRKIFIETTSEPLNYVVGDFNSDGFNDLAYILVRDRVLEICYGKNQNQFHKSINYLRNRKLTDINSFVDRGGSKLAILSDEMELILFERAAYGEEKFSSSFLSGVSAVAEFDYLNDGFNDFIFYDQSNKALSLFLNERRNLFRTCYSFPLLNEVDNILVDDLEPTEKTFFCYKKGKRSIEVVRFNFNNQKISSQVLFTKGEIVQLKISHDRLKDRQSIFALIQIADKIYLEQLEFKNFRFISSGEIYIDAAPLFSDLMINVFLEVYYISVKNSMAGLYKSIIERNKPKPILLKNLTSTNDFKIYSSKTADRLINRAKPFLLLLSKKNKPELQILLDNKFKTFYPKYIPEVNTPIYSRILDINGEIISYYRSGKKIVEIRYNTNNQKFTEKSIFETTDEGFFYITQNMSPNSFLFSSNKIEGTITIKKF
jgi:hypothetical protein